MGGGMGGHMSRGGDADDDTIFEGPSTPFETPIKTRGKSRHRPAMSSPVLPDAMALHKGGGSPAQGGGTGSSFLRLASLSRIDRRITPASALRAVLTLGESAFLLPGSLAPSDVVRKLLGVQGVRSAMGRAWAADGHDAQGAAFAELSLILPQALPLAPTVHHVLSNGTLITPQLQNKIAASTASGNRGGDIGCQGGGGISSEGGKVKLAPKHHSSHPPPPEPLATGAAAADSLDVGALDSTSAFLSAGSLVEAARHESEASQFTFHTAVTQVQDDMWGRLALEASVNEQSARVEKAKSAAGSVARAVRSRGSVATPAFSDMSDGSGSPSRSMHTPSLPIKDQLFGVPAPSLELSEADALLVGGAGGFGLRVFSGIRRVRIADVLSEWAARCLHAERLAGHGGVGEFLLPSLVPSAAGGGGGGVEGGAVGASSRHQRSNTTVTMGGGAGGGGRRGAAAPRSSAAAAATTGGPHRRGSSSSSHGFKRPGASSSGSLEAFPPSAAPGGTPPPIAHSSGVELVLGRSDARSLSAAKPFLTMVHEEAAAVNGVLDSYAAVLRGAYRLYSDSSAGALMTEAEFLVFAREARLMDELSDVNATPGASAPQSAVASVGTLALQRGAPDVPQAPLSAESADAAGVELDDWEGAAPRNMLRGEVHHVFRVVNREEDEVRSGGLEVFRPSDESVPPSPSGGALNASSTARTGTADSRLSARSISPTMQSSTALDANSVPLAIVRPPTDESRGDGSPLVGDSSTVLDGAAENTNPSSAVSVSSPPPSPELIPPDDFHGGDVDGENPLDELTPGEFVEAIVRLAAARYARLTSALNTYHHSAVVTAALEGGLPDAFAAHLSGVAAAHGARTSSSRHAGKGGVGGLNHDNSGIYSSAQGHAPATSGGGAAPSSKGGRRFSMMAALPARGSSSGLNPPTNPIKGGSKDPLPHSLSQNFPMLPSVLEDEGRSHAARRGSHGGRGLASYRQASRTQIAPATASPVEGARLEATVRNVQGDLVGPHNYAVSPPSIAHCLAWVIERHIIQFCGTESPHPFRAELQRPAFRKILAKHRGTTVRVFRHFCGLQQQRHALLVQSWQAHTAQEQSMGGADEPSPAPAVLALGKSVALGAGGGKLKPRPPPRSVSPPVGALRGALKSGSPARPSAPPSTQRAPPQSMPGGVSASLGAAADAADAAPSLGQEVPEDATPLVVQAPPQKPEPVPSDAWVSATWSAFLKTFGLVGSRLREQDARRLFGHVQNDEQGFDSSAELIFSEFEEALAALAAHWFRDPFVPLYRRLDRFVSKRLAGAPLPPLEQSPLSLAALPATASPRGASAKPAGCPSSPADVAGGTAPSMSMGSAFGADSMAQSMGPGASLASNKSGKRSKPRSKSPRRHK